MGEGAPTCNLQPERFWRCSGICNSISCSLKVRVFIHLSVHLSICSSITLCHHLSQSIFIYHHPTIYLYMHHYTSLIVHLSPCVLVYLSFYLLSAMTELQYWWVPLRWLPQRMESNYVEASRFAGGPSSNFWDRIITKRWILGKIGKQIRN